MVAKQPPQSTKLQLLICHFEFCHLEILETNLTIDISVVNRGNKKFINKSLLTS